MTSTDLRLQKVNGGYGYPNQTLNGTLNATIHFNGNYQPQTSSVTLEAYMQPLINKMNTISTNSFSDDGKSKRYYNSTLQNFSHSNDFIDQPELESDLATKTWKLLTAFSLGNIDKKFDTINEINTVIKHVGCFLDAQNDKDLIIHLNAVRNNGDKIIRFKTRNLKEIYFVGMGAIFGSLVLGSGIILKEPYIKATGLSLIGFFACYGIKKAGDFVKEAGMDHVYKADCGKTVNHWNQHYQSQNS